LDESIAAYHQALKLPDDTSGTPTTAHTLVHNNLGQLYQSQGKLNLAQQEFEVALKIDPKFKFAINNLEAVLKQQKQSVTLGSETHSCNLVS
jgi:superkiller protein 3